MEISQIPDHVRELWGKPPLLRSEDPKVYDKLAQTVVRAIEPGDGIEWLLVNDVVAHSWEIRRLRQFKTLLIELKREEDIACSDDEDEAREYGESEQGETSLFLNNLDHWEKIDYLLTVVEARRDAVLREIDRRRASFADRRRNASSHIIDGEFEERHSGPGHESGGDGGTPPEGASGPRRASVPRVLSSNRTSARS
jgi:hypothetical protein